MFVTIKRCAIENDASLIIILTNFVYPFSHLIELWQNGKEMIVESGHTEAMIRGLMPKSTYHVRIRAENEMGQSDWSVITSLTTDEEGEWKMLARLNHDHDYDRAR